MDLSSDNDIQTDGAGGTDITLLIIVGLPKYIISIPTSLAIIILFLMIGSPEDPLVKIPILQLVIKFFVIIGEHG